MIPLHLHSTTVHVTPEQAERLVAEAAAEWLPIPVRALISRRASDAEVFAVLS